MSSILRQMTIGRNVRHGAVLVVLIVSLSSCGTSNQGTVKGILSTYGGPPPGHRGIPGTVIFKSSTGKRFRTTANHAGQFTTAIPPGSYVASGSNAQFHIGPSSCTKQRVVIQAHSVSKIRIDCSVH